MDLSAVAIAIIGALTSVLVAYVANRYTARNAAAALRKTGEIERTKVDADAYQRARESYDAALAMQDRQIVQLVREASDDREEYRTEIADCKLRIQELENVQRVDLVYIRQLIAILRTHNLDYPPPPPGVDL